MESYFSDFLTLIRLGLTRHNYIKLGRIAWPATWDVAEKHGLSAILIDGIEKLPEAYRPPKTDLLLYIGEVIQGYEYRFEMYKRVIAEIAAFYNSHGIKMMVLKGYGCSINWPRPEHRPCGDIDIWLFGKQKEADELLKKEKGLAIGNDKQHHTIFYWKNFMVENHFDFLDVYHHKSNGELEKIFKELGEDDSLYVELYGEKVYLPSPSMHALFLLKHTISHFAAEGITLRQILDWGFFVEKQGKEVDWDWLMTIIEKYGLGNAFNVFNAICVEDLGFDSDIFPQVQFNPFLKNRVLRDILQPEFSGSLPKWLIPRVIFKIRRWRSNAWKHELCYKESMWSAFWSGVYNHLRKPSTI